MADAFPISERMGDKGAQGELIAAAWLVGLGYQVFRNVSPCGPVDVVAWIPGSDPILIDVKSVSSTSIYRRQDGTFMMPIRAPGADGVHHLYVADGRVIGFARQSPNGPDFYWPLAVEQVTAEIIPIGTWKDAVSMRKRRR